MSYRPLKKICVTILSVLTANFKVITDFKSDTKKENHNDKLCRLFGYNLGVYVQLDVTTVWLQCFREDAKRERLDPT